jgi:hypothetical protein
MESVSAKVDRLLDEAAMLKYGVPYNALGPCKASAVIHEVTLRFSPQQLEAGDAARKSGREGV